MHGDERACKWFTREEALRGRVVRDKGRTGYKGLGAPEAHMLSTMGNLAIAYRLLGRVELSMRMRKDIYFGWLNLKGEENHNTIREANNYATILVDDLRRFEEAKCLMRKMIPVARRVRGESDGITLRMRMNYALALCNDPASTLDDLREAVATLEDTARTARRVFGGAHPLTTGIEVELRKARAALRAREE